VDRRVATLTTGDFLHVRPDCHRWIKSARPL
jgi:hypothetical protein